MCLETIDRYETLTEDLKIYKVISGDDVHELPEFNRNHDYASEREHIAVKRWAGKVYSNDRWISYRAGFHGFLTKSNALRWLGSENGKRIALYIIPKGTKVLFGTQSIFCWTNMKCVVSPVMINPRVKE